MDADKLLKVTDGLKDIPIRELDNVGRDNVNVGRDNVNLESFIDTFSNYGIKVIPHYDKDHYASGNGLRIEKNPRQMEADNFLFYVLDREISSTRIITSYENNKNPETMAINIPEYLQRLENSLFDGHESHHRFKHQGDGAIPGSILIIDRYASIPSERIELIDNGSELKEWRGYTTDYRRSSHDEKNTTLDVSAIGREEQITNPQGIVGIIDYEDNCSDLIVPIYSMIYNNITTDKKDMPKTNDEKMLDLLKNLSNLK